MNMNIEFELGDYGTRAIIKSAWHEHFTALLFDNNVSELELNHAKGWYGNNVDFLQHLPYLKSFIIVDFNIALESIKGVHFLHKLQSLNITTYCKTPINFNFFPKLENCSFQWRGGSESLFECKSLNRLFLNNYNKSNSNVFSNLINLEQLTILNSPIEDLFGVASLQRLKYLSIGNLKKLKSLHGIGELQQLEELVIDTCKEINNIAEIFKIKLLKKIMLLNLGNIESIKGIENLTQLETFLFYESTNIVDGDLSPLLKLNRLSKISFQNRKHYSQRREDFGNLYSNTLPPPAWR